ncbi:hypothetical protein SLA2020_100960 [Shorea laevis]
MFNLWSISINMEDESAWVGAGATLGELYSGIFQKTKVHGFAGGLCPTVWVVFNPYGGRMAEIKAMDTDPMPHRAGNLFKIQYSSPWTEPSKEAAKNNTNMLK